MPRAGFEPAIPASTRPQTYVLDDMAGYRVKFETACYCPNNYKRWHAPSAI